MAARAISRRAETNNQPIDPTASSRHDSFSGSSNMFRPSCSTWNDCLVTTMFTFLLTGVAMFIFGFLVPRFPPSSAKTDLTAREYEAMATWYSKRGHILDIVLVLGLACMVVVAGIISLLHALMYYDGYQSISSENSAPSRPRAVSSNESFAMSGRIVRYGGLDTTEH